MIKRLFLMAAALLLTAGTGASPGWANDLTPVDPLTAVGPVSAPHGFPLWYQDSNNLQLEICFDPGWCFFDPVPENPLNDEALLGVGGEVFWWMGDAEAPSLVEGGDEALLVLALEGTFGGAEDVVNGQQISFGRVRVRVDVPVPGTYTVTYPYGTLIFEDVTVEDGINYTADIGSANFFSPEAGFLGTLSSPIGPFLTWPDYRTDITLQVPIFEGDVQTGQIQYVGDGQTPHVVVGSPLNQNFFRVEGPGGIVTETNLFTIQGREYDGKQAVAHVYGESPVQNLSTLGPINRLADFGNNGTLALTAPPGPAVMVDGVPGTVPVTPVTFVTDGTEAGYPLGYPTYYEDASGLQLTICQGGNPMCISDPVNLADPVQRALRTGGEIFWWSADASIEYDDDHDFDLVLGKEGTFGGDESPVDGEQIAFGRTRIRIDTPVAGDYIVIYPYGYKVFHDVPADDRGINFTADIGVSDPRDPDFSFVGALYSEIGPNFLVTEGFDINLDVATNSALGLVRQEPAVDANGAPIEENGQPVTRIVHYVGNLAPTTVTGGNLIGPFTVEDFNGDTFEFAGEVVNYFRVIGPGINVSTNLFELSGRVYDPLSFRVIPQIGVPVANPDLASTIGTTPVTIDVLANDTLSDQIIDPAVATVTQNTAPTAGTIQINGGTITYTYTGAGPLPATDTFVYTVTATVNGVTSAPVEGTVTVTILPEEVVTITRAQLRTNALRWDIRGTANETAEGALLTIGDGTNTLGTATVTNGKWRWRGTLTTAPPANPVITVTSANGTYGPFTVQVR